MTTSEISAAASGTFALGGDRTVHRLGYGTMQLPGPGVWGAPRDRGEAIRVLRRGWSWASTCSTRPTHTGRSLPRICCREALYPYEGITIATKGGFVRTGPGEWYPVGRPEYLRQCVEMSLRRLDTERIDLYQLHRIDPQVPLEDQVGALAEMQSAGKIRQIGLSEVGVDQILPHANRRDRLSAEPVQPGRPDRRARDRILRAGESRVYPVVSTRQPRSDEDRRFIRCPGGRDIRDSDAACPCLAALAITGDSSNPRDKLARTSGGERRCCRRAAD